MRFALLFVCLLLTACLCIGAFSVEAQKTDPSRSLDIITADNAHRLEYLGLVGRGNKDQHVWSADANTLAVVNRLRGVWLYHAADLRLSGDPVDTITPMFIPADFGDYLTAVQFSPNSHSLLLTSRQALESYISLWDVASGTRQWQMIEPSVWLIAPPVWSPNGRWLAYAAYQQDQTLIKMIDAETGVQQWQTIWTKDKNIQHLQFSSDSNRLLIADEKGTAQLIDIVSQDVEHAWSSENDVFLTAAFSRDSQWLALYQQSALKLYNLQTGLEYAVPQIYKELPQNAFYQMLFSPESRWLAVSSAGLMSSMNQPFVGIGLWDMVTKQWHQTFPGTAPMVFTETGLAFTGQTQTLTSIPSLLLWNTATNSLEPLTCSYDSAGALRHFLRENCPLGGLAHYYNDHPYSESSTEVTFDPTSSSYGLLLTEPHGSLSFDLTNLSIAYFDSADNFINRHIADIIISSDGRYVLRRLFMVGCACPNGGWEISETDGQKRWGYVGDINPFGGFNENTATASLAISPDQEFVVTGHAKGVIRLWRVEDTFQQTYSRFDTGHELNILQAHTLSADNGNTLDQVVVAGLVFHPNGTLISVARSDSDIRFWEMPSGRSTGRISTPFSYGFDALAISPDGRWLATNNGVWDLSTKTLIYSFAPMDTVLFTPDSQILMASQNNHLIIMDSMTGKILFQTPTEYHSPLGDTLSMAISPDGKLLVTVANGVIRAWGVTHESL